MINNHNTNDTTTTTNNNNNNDNNNNDNNNDSNNNYYYYYYYIIIIIIDDPCVRRGRLEQASGTKPISIAAVSRCSCFVLMFSLVYYYILFIIVYCHFMACSYTLLATSY